MSANPYTVKNIDNNETINIYRDGNEVFRLVRRGVWALHRVINGELQPEFITKDRYRHDLIERIQLGRYDETEKS